MSSAPDLDTSYGRLRWARERAGFAKAADFARVVHVDPVTYRAHESGQNGYAKYATDYALKLGVSTDWLLRGGPSLPETTVRTEVRGTGMTPQEARDAWTMRDAKPLPLLGTAFGGEWTDDIDIETTELHLDQVMDHLGRPPSLAGDDDAYAVEIVGESMAPRFEPGEFAFVSPKAPVRIGDDVIVQLRGAGEDQLADRVTMVLIKRLVRRSPSFVELRQFNPDKTFRVPADRVRHIHRVKGRL